MPQKFSAFPVLIMFIGLAFIGCFFVPLLRINLTSSRNTSSLDVRYSWPGASAKLMEEKVTSRLEGLFSSIDGLSHINSTSYNGLGLIDLEFKDGVDLDAVRFELANRIRQNYSKMPDGLGHPEISVGISAESESPFLSYSINSTENPYQIKKYVDTYLLPKLANINGVGQIEVFGAVPVDRIISYDMDRITHLGLTVDEINEAVTSFLKRMGIGTQNVVSKFNNQLQLPVQLTFKRSQNIDWKRIPIKKLHNNRIVFLEDIARISLEESEVKTYYRVDGLNTLNLAIYPIKGVNTIELSNSVKSFMDMVKKDVSNRYTIKLNKDTTAFLVRELGKIKIRIFISLFIILLFTLLVYRNIKYASIIVLGTTVTLLIAIIFYYAFKLELHLYSFAGITLSFGIIIDNSIVMLDHLRNRGNTKVILAILAATLTTIAAVSVIFYLPENQRVNLLDFTLIIIINLAVSFMVSLYFVPALMKLFGLSKIRERTHFNRRRRILRMSKRYYNSFTFFSKPPLRISLLLVFILGFGIPLHLAPAKLKGDGFWTQLYNQSLAHEWFSSKVRPTLEKLIGGTFRLFAENTFENSYAPKPQRVELKMTGIVPRNVSIRKLNGAVKKIEDRLATFEEIDWFETYVSSHGNTTISIFFKENYESGPFPYDLKVLLESMALEIGSVGWTVTGVGRGFSNISPRSQMNSHIGLEGYHYEELYDLAEKMAEFMKTESNGRIGKIEIGNGDGYGEVPYEYHLNIENELLSLMGISFVELYQYLKTRLSKIQLQAVVDNNELRKILLIPHNLEKFSFWDLKNIPIVLSDGHQFKLRELASIEKRKSGFPIKRIDRQYRLTLAYTYLGSHLAAEKFKKRMIANFSDTVPIGFKVNAMEYEDAWDKAGKSQYYFILIVIASIFIISAILLESLIQPLAVILMIPISFIGVFLTFYIFDFNFDQGGYASLILLSGISINSALYIVNDFNNFKKEFQGRDLQWLYFKAFNFKILPILFTVTSTIIGMLPFLWGGENEVFWFSFAIGTIGGLLFSLIAIVIYLPLFLSRSMRALK